MRVQASNDARYVREIAQALNVLTEYVKPYIVTATTAHTVTVANEVVLGNATGGSFTVTLPPAKDFARQFVAVKKTDATVNTVTIDGDGSETIDGAATLVISTQWVSKRLVSNGVAWFTV